MLEYLSGKHNDNLKIKEKQLTLEEKKLKLECIRGKEMGTNCIRGKEMGTFVFTRFWSSTKRISD